MKKIKSKIVLVFLSIIFLFTPSSETKGFFGIGAGLSLFLGMQNIMKNLWGDDGGMGKALSDILSQANNVIDNTYLLYRASETVDRTIRKGRIIYNLYGDIQRNLQNYEINLAEKAELVSILLNYSYKQSTDIGKQLEDFKAKIIKVRFDVNFFKTGNEGDVVDFFTIMNELEKINTKLDGHIRILMLTDRFAMALIHMNRWENGLYSYEVYQDLVLREMSLERRH